MPAQAVVELIGAVAAGGDYIRDWVLVVTVQLDQMEAGVVEIFVCGLFLLLSWSRGT